MGKTESNDPGRLEPLVGSARPAVRIGDADRQNVIALLCTACGDGQITLDEFADRAGVVYAARTQGELDGVLSDLSLPQTFTTAQPVPSTKAPRGLVVAIMNGIHRRGTWRVGPQTTAFALWGGIKLDLRNAVLEGPVIEIRAWAIMGGVDIIVPEGIPVEMSGMVVMGGTVNRVKDMPAIRGAPLVRIKARGLWGGVGVHSRRVKERAPSTAAPAPTEAPVRNSLPPGGVYDERAPDPELTAIADSVRQAPFDNPLPAGADGTVTILFSDIEGSTELADRLGDHRWLDLLREHNKLVREQVAIAGGYEVKTQGDGFMVTFPGAGRALRCAVEIQRKMAAFRETHPDTPVQVRIGVHTGEVLADGDDIYGKHVMIAARVASQAKGGEVLASSLVRELADGGRLQFGPGRDVELRGLERPWRLYPVDWA